MFCEMIESAARKSAFSKRLLGTDQVSGFNCLFPVLILTFPDNFLEASNDSSVTSVFIDNYKKTQRAFRIYMVLLIEYDKSLEWIISHFSTTHPFHFSALKAMKQML